MKNLLIINSSGRVSRSITRHLTARFDNGWKSGRPGARSVQRDVGLTPPPPVNETWIAGAYAAPSDRTPAMQQAMDESDRLIDEIFAADAIILGVPMYNFGMPAQLKAYFDQIVRVGRTFDFDPAAENPYLPLVADRPVVAILSAGDGSFHIGGALAHLNFLEPHLRTILEFIGLTDVTFVRAGYDEYQDDRAKRSLAAAESAVDQVLQRLQPEGELVGA